MVMTTAAAATATAPMADVRRVDLGTFQGCTFLRVKKHKITIRVKVRDNDAYLSYLQLLKAEKDAAEKSADGKPVRVDTSLVAADVPKARKNGGADESKVAAKGTKQLLVSKTLDELNGFVQMSVDKIIGRFGIAQPSRIIEGLYFVRDVVPGPNGDRDLRDEVESIIENAREQVRTKFLPAFVASYAQDIENTRTLPLLKGGLGPIFDPSDYPDSAEEFAGNLLGGTPTSYGISRMFVDLSVANTLSAKLRAKCEGEYQLQVQEAATEAVLALRVGLGKFIDNLVERLTPSEDGKKKTFRDTLTENIREFCAAFESRNFANDKALAEVVAKCKATLEGVEPEKLRKYENVRDNVLSRFEEIKKVSDSLIVSVPGRKFDLSDED